MCIELPAYVYMSYAVAIVIAFVIALMSMVIVYAKIIQKMKE